MAAIPRRTVRATVGPTGQNARRLSRRERIVFHAEDLVAMDVNVARRKLV